MNEEQKTDYPKHWDTCPNCGSTHRLINDIREELITQGRWDPRNKVALTVQQVVFADPSKTSLMLTIPILIIMTDVCADCGTVYTIHAELTQGRPELVKTPPGPGMPGGLPKGFKQFPS